ncbi:MAG: hypothetical protein Q9193_002367 [Seirophora villosa]
MFFAARPDQAQSQQQQQICSLRRHDFYGTFAIDLQVAWSTRDSTASFPPEDLWKAEASDHREHEDPECNSRVHAVFMIGTFVVTFPIGNFCKRVLGNVRWQYLGCIIMFVGAGPGLGLSHF